MHVFANRFLTNAKMEISRSKLKYGINGCIINWKHCTPNIVADEMLKLF